MDRKHPQTTRSHGVPLPKAGVGAVATSVHRGATAARETHPPARPHVRGRFLFRGDEKLYLKGVTYGTFPPNARGEPYPEPGAARSDFACMAAPGINAVRTYTVPPTWLLDLALEHDLLVLVGLPWEQHLTFLDDRRRVKAIRDELRHRVRGCSHHPAVLAFALGNEIPAPIVRWHGRKRVERFLERLCSDVREEAPGALVTYVNYPTTEHLELPFLDFLAFNVYLESDARFRDYLSRLHNLAGERPLVMAELGLDSRRNGLDRQADAVEQALGSAFASGCAGAFVFAWSDAWQRGGTPVDDWDFGLTSRERVPKPALAAAERGFADAPLPASPELPLVSVVVCSHNGGRTISETLQGLERLAYPRFEVIVVDDGSSDETAAIAETFDVRLIRTPNRGLGSARNTGLEAAAGEVIAYLDDDAWPDPHWLQYLVQPLLDSDAVAAGGPNLPPADDPPVACAVANAPGGPTHVLIDDATAEHVPGCNMAFRADSLRAVGGFDERYRAAGDDVDVCWRLQRSGGRIGFHPSAVVWHRRRDSVRAYWKQQVGYGRAEALLAEAWPDRYNGGGHVAWTGRVYGRGLPAALVPRSHRIYGGVWGSAPFQQLYRPRVGGLESLALLPEAYLGIGVLAALAGVGAVSSTFALVLPLLACAVALPVAHAVAAAARAPIQHARGRGNVSLRAVIAGLYLIQPAARLRGRMEGGLTPWRRHGAGRAVPWVQTVALWRERRLEHPAWLQQVERGLSERWPVRRGGEFDRWDLEIRGGAFGRVRLLSVVEEHGEGRQLARFRIWPWIGRRTWWAKTGVALFAVLAGVAGAWGPAALLGVLLAFIAVRALGDCAAATAAAVGAMDGLEGAEHV